MTSGGSNGDWGQLAEHDTELADAWDGYARLPEPGVSAALDAFVASKNITIGDLVRVGARLADDYVLAFAAPGGLKFRDIVSGRRWSFAGSEWREMKIVPAQYGDASICVIAEGESDSARLSGYYQNCAVAIMPAGAGYFPDTYAAQVQGYDRVLVGLDPDAAGERGAAAIMDKIAHAERFCPPNGDWCEATELPPIPLAPERRVEQEFLVSAGDLLTLEPPEHESWFDDALLPVAGQLILHGWAKSFKTFAGLDIMAAIAQSVPWCGFEPTAGPARVGVIQFEIVWAWYQKRVQAIREHAPNPELFDQNFMTVTPLSRPPLVAGDTKLEDRLIAELLDAGIEVVLIDPIRRALGSVNINASEDIRPILAYAQRLQDAGITVVMTHHDSKAGARSGGGSPLSMTGAGDFAGDADSIVSVAVPQGSTLREPRRNLFFTLRNGPSPSPRGMEMTEQGHLRYQQEPFGEGMDDDSHGPTI